VTLLNFSDSGEKPAGRRKPLRAILGIGALVGAVALGSTLAASINLNDSGPVEFGQGVTQTVACSGNDSIIVTPTSSFINADGAGDYYFTSVTLSSIPSGCNGVDFTIAAYDNSGNIMRLSTGFCSLVGEKPVVNFDGSDSAPTEESSNEMFSEVIDADSSSFTLRWIDGMPNGCSSAALAEDVYRITIESSGTTQEVGLTGWSDVTWTETNSNGPTVYANSLTSGQPSWIDEVNADFGALSFGFTSNGMHITGDADDQIDAGEEYPYVTDFDIPENQKVTIQFNFFFNDECADHGVILFNTTTPPYWDWNENQTGLAGQWDCGWPDIGAPDGSVGGAGLDRSPPGLLTVGQAYIGIFTYDPTLTTNNLTLVTKELDGEVIDTTSFTSKLPSGNYRIGFSADQDDGEPNSYFKNLIITLG
jgi:hypothetical protein